MVKKIGNKSHVYMCAFGIIGLSLSFFMNAAVPQINLQVINEKGKLLTQVQVGEQFVVQAIVTGDHRSLPKPEINGMDGLKQLRTQTGTQIQSINGKTTVSEQLMITVRADKVGTFTIGPAVIDVNGQKIFSEQLTLDVVIETAQSLQQQAEEEECFVRIEVDKKQVYVGEPVMVTLRFYQENNQITLEGISKPEFEEYFTGKELKGPVSSTTLHKGKKYKTVEWKTTLYPKASGKAILPPVTVLYSSKVENSSMSDMFNIMENFFGAMKQKEQITSNAVSIDVMPLPDTDSVVKAVGEFTLLKARINNSTASEGEGLVYTLEVEGRGNLDQISHPSIRLPEGLTYYESNSRVDEKQENKKSFEYIIQGLNPGEYTIPVQSLTFFDLSSKNYKTISSEPLPITITASGKKNKLNKDEDDKPLLRDSEISDDVLPFETEEKYNWHALPAISWWIFFILVTVPLMWLGIDVGIKKYRKYQEKNAPELRYRYAFKNARTLFYRARTKGYDGQLYHMYRELFSARLRISKYELSEQLIEDLLRSHGVSEEKIIQWRIHFAYLAEVAFVPHRMGEKDIKLFNAAALWLDELENFL